MVGVVEDEAALLERLRAREEEAFAFVVDRDDAALRRVASAFLRTTGAVEEVVAETWLAVIAGLDGFEGRSTLRTWIFAILVNRARTRAARERRSVPFSSLEDGGRPAVDPAAFGEDGRWRSAPIRLERDPHERLLARELRAGLLEAIDALPPRQRAVITLRDVVGCPPGEVGEMLGLSDGNQRVLLHRARAHVREALLAGGGAR
jgi:RNA polymerase sigma-70 factor (ECF subfamily)